MSEEERSHKERLLKYFDFSEPVSLSGSRSIPLSNVAETPLAKITLEHIRSNDRVLIQAVIGWQISATASIPNPEVRFRIYRGSAPLLGVLVSDVVDCGSGLGRRFITGWTHAETGVVHGAHDYTITGSVTTGAAGDVVISGPVGEYGSNIDENGT